nr:MAG TPA: hypothetical protein [Caudoviricetes sp.]
MNPRWVGQPSQHRERTHRRKRAVTHQNIILFLLFDWWKTR